MPTKTSATGTDTKTATGVLKIRDHIFGTSRDVRDFARRIVSRDVGSFSYTITLPRQLEKVQRDNSAEGKHSNASAVTYKQDHFCNTKAGRSNLSLFRTSREQSQQASSPITITLFHVNGRRCLPSYNCFDRILSPAAVLRNTIRCGIFTRRIARKTLQKMSAHSGTTMPRPK